jgi:probable HAF family extracellular repeat protein
MTAFHHVALLASCFAAVSSASAYQVHDLSSIVADAGYGQSYFSGLNNRGTVAGHGSGTPGFFTLQNGLLYPRQLVPYSYDPAFPLVQPPNTFEIALDINDRNDVLGIANINYQPNSFLTAEYRGFIWSGSALSSGSRVEWLSADDSGVTPVALNNYRRVVGIGGVPGSSTLTRVKTTVADSAWTLLQPLPGDTLSTVLSASGGSGGGRVVNDSGHIIGQSYSAQCCGGSQAVVWRGGAAVELPGGTQYSEAYAINKAGHIAGVVDGRAVMWQEDAVVELGNLIGFAGFSGAYAINDYGHAVGSSDSFNDVFFRSAFIWQNGQMTDLNTLYALPDDFWATAATSINNRGQIMVDAARMLGDGSVEQRKFLISPGPLSRLPVIQPGTPDEAFSARAALVPTGGTIGRVSASPGNFYIERSNGDRILHLAGETPQLSLGDVVESIDGPVKVTFNDATDFEVSPQSRITLDEYVFDPDPQEGRASLLREVFTFFSERLPAGEDRNVVIEGKNLGVLGFRGDAADYIDPDLLDVSVKMNVGSPVSLSTFVKMPDAPFELSFEYVFLTGTGVLEVYFEDLQVGSFVAALDDAGIFRRAVLQIDDPDVLAMPDARLSFIFDGPSGAQMLIDDVAMPGLAIGGFDGFDEGWYKDGPGSLELAATISEGALAQITAVPEPGTWAMLVSGLLLVVAATGRSHAPSRRCLSQ